MRKRVVTWTNGGSTSYSSLEYLDIHKLRKWSSVHTSYHSWWTVGLNVKTGTVKPLEENTEKILCSWIRQTVLKYATTGTIHKIKD